jgi:structural maintenance of chromosome 3 (chondroitin sulfate proteoglycan 6)
LFPQIEQCVEFIEARLEELERDKAELVEYQALDREKRCIEFAIWDKDLDEARSGLAKVGRQGRGVGKGGVGCG